MLIRVKVTTGAKKEAVTATGKDRLDISLKEKPERNMANKRLVVIIRIHFKAKPGTVKIVKGHKAPSKIVSINKSDLE